MSAHVWILSEVVTVGTIEIDGPAKIPATM